MRKINFITVVFQLITLVQVISGGKAARNLTHEEGKNKDEVEVFDNSLESGYTRDWFDALASSGMDTVGGNLSLNHGNDISFEDNGLFDNSLQPLSDSILEGLPISFINADVSSFAFKTTNGSAQEILSIFFVLQMIGKGHPSSKPYIKEICSTVYPSSDLDHCHKFLQDAVSKHDQELLFNDSEFNTSKGKIFFKSYQSLVFQMNEILNKSSSGVDMVEDMCLKTARKAWVICKNDFERGIEALKKFWNNAVREIKELNRKPTGCFRFLKSCIIRPFQHPFFHFQHRPWGVLINNNHYDSPSNTLFKPCIREDSKFNKNHVRTSFKVGETIYPYEQMYELVENQNIEANKELSEEVKEALFRKKARKNSLISPCDLDLVEVQKNSGNPSEGYTAYMSTKPVKVIEQKTEKKNKQTTFRARVENVFLLAKDETSELVHFIGTDDVPEYLMEVINKWPKMPPSSRGG